MSSINLNLIPFGLRSDGSFVDVHDVPNGKKCDCECPSCHTPLIARQGDIKEWHFAHFSSKDSIEKTSRDCEYSFFVSVQLMAMQLIQHELKITLPPLRGLVVSEPIIECGGINVSEEFTVVPSQTIELKNILLKTSGPGNVIDIAGTIRDYRFFILFSYPGREISAEFSHPEDKKCGIISIALDNTRELFLNAKETNQSYQELLYQFLQSDLQSKTWLYHPRYPLEKAQAKHRLEIKKETLIQKYQQRSKHMEKPPSSINSVLFRYKPIKTEPSHVKVLYQCLNCQHQWQESENGAKICPKCHNHLYTQIIKRLDNPNT